METSAPHLQDTEQPVAYDQAYEPQPEVQEPITTREELLSRYGDRTLTYGKYEGTVSEIIKGDVCPHFKSMPDFALIKTVEVILVASEAKAKAEEMISAEKTLPEPKQESENLAQKISSIVHETEKITAPLLQSADEIIDVSEGQQSQPPTGSIETQKDGGEAVEPFTVIMTRKEPGQLPVAVIELKNHDSDADEIHYKTLIEPVTASSSGTDVHVEGETTTSDNIVLEAESPYEAPFSESVAQAAGTIELPTLVADFEETNSESPDVFIKVLLDDLDEITTAPTERLIIMSDSTASEEEIVAYDELITNSFERLNEQQNIEAQDILLEIVELLETFQTSETEPSAKEKHLEQLIVLIRALADTLNLSTEPALLQRLADIVVQKMQVSSLSYMELLELKNRRGTSEHLLYGIGKSLQTSFSLHSLLGHYVLTQLA